MSNRRGGVHSGRNLSQAFASTSPSKTQKPRRPIAEQGLFIDNVWHCNCRPRLVAKHRVVNKAGPNRGRWFYTCQKTQSEQCDFFLFDDDAEPRMKTGPTNDKEAERSPQNERKTVSFEAEPEGPSSQRPKRRLPWSSDGTSSFSSTSTEAEATKARSGVDLAGNQIDNITVLQGRTTATHQPANGTRLGEPLELDPPRSQKRKLDPTVAESTNPRKSLRFEAHDSQPFKKQLLNDSGLSNALLEEDHEYSSDSGSGIGYQEALELDSVVHKSKNGSAESSYMTPVSPGRYYDALKVPPQLSNTPKSPVTPSSAALLHIADEVFHVLARSPEKPVITQDIQNKLGSIFRKYTSRVEGLRKSRDMMRDARAEALRRIDYLQNRIGCLEGEIAALRAVNSLARK